MDADHVYETVRRGTDFNFDLRFETDPDSGWYVGSVVELPGCISQGSTLEEAKTNLMDAIEAYIGVLCEDAIRAKFASVPSAMVDDRESQKIHIEQFLKMRVA